MTGDLIMIKKVLIGLAILALAGAFHYAMMQDKKALCANDATAYEGC